MAQAQAAQEVKSLTAKAHGAYKRGRYEAAAKHLEDAKAVLSHAGIWQENIEIAARVEALLRIVREKANETSSPPQG